VAWVALATDAPFSGGLQEPLGCALGSLAPSGADVLVAVASAGLHAEKRAQGIAECRTVGVDF
jgi:hypothetical protein